MRRCRHSLGTSVGGVLPAIRNVQLVIAQVKRHMPYVFGDRSIVMLAATSPDGTRSHLVRNLAPLRPVTLPSWLADTFVTDHGVAGVRHLGKSAKARAIAAIASPRFRELRGGQEPSVSGDDTVR